jgi:hypothetical protein
MKRHVISLSDQEVEVFSMRPLKSGMFDRSLINLKFRVSKVIISIIVPMFPLKEEKGKHTNVKAPLIFCNGLGVNLAPECLHAL